MLPEGPWMFTPTAAAGSPQSVTVVHDYSAAIRPPPPPCSKSITPHPHPPSPCSKSILSPLLCFPHLCPTPHTSCREPVHPHPAAASRP